MEISLSLVVLGVLVLMIGISLGATGYGGFVVPVLLVLLLGSDPRDAVAYGLLSFIIPGLVGAWLYRRRGHRPDWRLVGLLCAGTVPGVGLGRLVSLTAPAWVLQLIVAALVVAGGLSVLVRRRRAPAGQAAAGRAPVGQAPADRELARPAVRHSRWVRIGVPLGAGVLAGAASVLAGVGGPLITVPVLLALGLGLGPVVAAALLNAVFGVALGAGALADRVHLDWPLLVLVTVAQLIGMPIGVWLQARLGRRLVPVVAALAIASGVGLGWHTLVGG